VLNGSIAAALLVGCAGPASPVGVPGAAVETVASKTEPLLYVARTHDVAIVSPRTGKTVASIKGFSDVGGVCSDASGNVWVPNLHRGSWYLDKFSPGATKQTQELHAPRASFLVACAVNPSNGDLAVPGYDKNGRERVLIWSPATAAPTIHTLTACPVGAAYDRSNDLFVTGWACGSTFNALLEELGAGSSGFDVVRLDKTAGPLGGIAWDGTDLAIAVSSKFHSELFRVYVNGNVGTVVGVVHLQGLNVCCWGTPTGLFVLNHGEAIGEAGKDEQSIFEWRYPAGGKSLRTIRRYSGIDGLALSP
jgi:hypothetical protein